MSVDKHNIVEKTLALKSAVVDMLAEANADKPALQQVSIGVALQVVARSLEASSGKPFELREFSALRDLSNFIVLAQDNRVVGHAAVFADLLPVAHPASKARHAMTASALVNARLRWFGVSDAGLGSLVASGVDSAEFKYLSSRVLAAGFGPEVVESLVAALTAAGDGNSYWARRMRAMKQRRDRKGRFAWMGGGFRNLIRDLNGKISWKTGRVVGASADGQTVDVEYSDGSIARMPVGKGEAMKAVLKKGAAKDVAPSVEEQSDIIDEKDIQFVDAPSGWQQWNDKSVGKDGSEVTVFRHESGEYTVARRKNADGSVEFSVIDDRNDYQRKNIGMADSWVGVSNLIKKNTSKKEKDEVKAQLLGEDKEPLSAEDIADLFDAQEGDDEGVKEVGQIAEEPEAPEAEAPSATGVPERAYKLDLDGFEPEGNTGQDSDDYTDDPKELAARFDKKQIATALRSALIPAPGSKKDVYATGYGALPFSDGDEQVPAEALYKALRLQGVNSENFTNNSYKKFADEQGVDFTPIDIDKKPKAEIPAEAPKKKLSFEEELKQKKALDEAAKKIMEDAKAAEAEAIAKANKFDAKDEYEKLYKDYVFHKKISREEFTEKSRALFDSSDEDTKKALLDFQDSSAVLRSKTMGIDLPKMDKRDEEPKSDVGGDFNLDGLSDAAVAKLNDYLDKPISINGNPTTMRDFLTSNATGKGRDMVVTPAAEKAAMKKAEKEGVDYVPPTPKPFNKIFLDEEHNSYIEVPKNVYDAFEPSSGFVDDKISPTTPEVREPMPSSGGSFPGQLSPNGDWEWSSVSLISPEKGSWIKTPQGEKKQDNPLDAQRIEEDKAEIAAKAKAARAEKFNAADEIIDIDGSGDVEAQLKDAIEKGAKVRLSYNDKSRVVLPDVVTVSKDGNPFVVTIDENGEYKSLTLSKIESPSEALDLTPDATPTVDIAESIGSSKLSPEDIDAMLEGEGIGEDDAFDDVEAPAEVLSKSAKAEALQPKGSWKMSDLNDGDVINPSELSPDLPNGLFHVTDVEESEEDSEDGGFTAVKFKLLPLNEDAHNASKDMADRLEGDFDPETGAIDVEFQDSKVTVFGNKRKLVADGVVEDFHADEIEMPEPVGAPRKAKVLVKDLQAGDVLANDFFVVESVYSDDESEAAKPGSVWVTGYYPGHESQKTKLWYPEDDREVFRDVEIPAKGDKPALSKPKMKEFGKLTKVDGQWRVKDDEGQAKYEAAKAAYDAQLADAKASWSAPVDAPEIDLTSNSVNKPVKMSVVASDLKPGDVAYGDESPNKKYGVDKYEQFFVIDEVFEPSAEDIAANPSLQGKVGVKGHFPGHKSQEKFWNAGTPISVIRGADVPAAGDKDELHRPKLSDYEKTDEGLAQYAADSKAYHEAKKAASADFVAPDVEDYVPAEKVAAAPSKPGRSPQAPAFQGDYLTNLVKEANGDPAKLKELLDNEEVVYFDFETTGQNKNFGPDSRPIQVAAYKIKNGEVVDKFDIFMNPGEPLADFYYKDGVLNTEIKTPEGAMISDEWLAQQPSVDEAMKQFLDWMGPEPILGGQNVAGFDEPILRYIASNMGYPYSFKGMIDSQSLAKSALPKGTKVRLGDLAARYDVNLEGWHDARADALAVHGIVNGLLGEMAETGNGSIELDPDSRLAQYEADLADYDAKVAAYKAFKEAENAAKIEEALTDESKTPSVDELVQNLDTTPAPNVDGVFNNPAEADNPPAGVPVEIPADGKNAAWVLDDENTSLIEGAITPDDFKVGDFFPTKYGTNFHEIISIKEDPEDPNKLIVSTKIVNSDSTYEKKYYRFNKSFEGVRRPVNNVDAPVESPAGSVEDAVDTPVSPEMPESVTAVADGVSTPIDIAGWKKVGGQAGSNSGGVYEDENGNRFYVKVPKSAEHAKSEVLASALYDAAGVKVGRVLFGKDGDGNLVTVSPWVNDAKNDFYSEHNKPSVKKDAQAGFAVDAWLMNWDTVGLGYDNMVTSNGEVYRIDPGGSLLFRAQGAKKDSKFVTPEVQEIDSMRKQGTAGSVFGDMSDEDIAESVKKVASVSPEKISELVDTAFADDPALAGQLKELLIARRQDLINRFATPSQPSAVAEAVEDANKFDSPDKIEAPVADKPEGVADFTEKTELSDEDKMYKAAFDLQSNLGEIVSVSATSKFGEDIEFNVNVDADFDGTKVEASYNFFFDKNSGKVYITDNNPAGIDEDGDLYYDTVGVYDDIDTAAKALSQEIADKTYAVSEEDGDVSLKPNFGSNLGTASPVLQDIFKQHGFTVSYNEDNNTLTITNDDHEYSTIDVGVSSEDGKLWVQGANLNPDEMFGFDNIGKFENMDEAFPAIHDALMYSKSLYAAKSGDAPAQADDPETLEVADLVEAGEDNVLSAEELIDAIKAEKEAAKAISKDPSLVVEEIKKDNPYFYKLDNGHMVVREKITNVGGVDYKHEVVVARNSDETFTVYGLETNMETGEQRFILYKSGNRRHSYKAIKTKIEGMSYRMFKDNPVKAVDKMSLDGKVKKSLSDFGFYPDDSVDVDFGSVPPEASTPAQDLNATVQYLNDVTFPKTDDAVKDALLILVENMAKTEGISKELLDNLYNFPGVSKETVDDVIDIVNKNAMVKAEVKPNAPEGKVLGKAPHVSADGVTAVKAGDRVLYVKDGKQRVGTVYQLTEAQLTVMKDGTYAYSDFTWVDFGDGLKPKKRSARYLQILSEDEFNKLNSGELDIPEPTYIPEYKGGKGTNTDLITKFDSSGEKKEKSETLPPAPESVVFDSSVESIDSASSAEPNEGSDEDAIDITDLAKTYAKPPIPTESGLAGVYELQLGSKKVEVLTSNDSLAYMVGQEPAVPVALSDMKVNDVIFIKDEYGDNLPAQVIHVSNEFPGGISRAALYVKAKNGDYSIKELKIPGKTVFKTYRPSKPIKDYVVKGGSVTPSNSPSSAKEVAGFVDAVNTGIKSDADLASKVDTAAVDSAVSAANNIVDSIGKPVGGEVPNYSAETADQFEYVPTKFNEVKVGSLVTQSYVIGGNKVYVVESIEKITKYSMPYTMFNLRNVEDGSSTYFTVNDDKLHHYMTEKKVLKHKSEISSPVFSHTLKKVLYADVSKTAKFSNSKVLGGMELQVGDLIPMGTGKNRRYLQVLAVNAVVSRSSDGSNPKTTRYATYRTITQDENDSLNGYVGTMELGWSYKNVKRPTSKFSKEYMSTNYTKPSSSKSSSEIKSVGTSADGVKLFNTMDDLVASGSFDKTTPEFLEEFGASSYMEYKIAYKDSLAVVKDGSSSGKYIIPGLIVVDKDTQSVGIVKSVKPGGGPIDWNSGNNADGVEVAFVSGSLSGTTSNVNSKSLEATNNMFTEEAAAKLGVDVDPSFKEAVKNNIEANKAKAEAEKLAEEQKKKIEAEMKKKAKEDFEKNFPKGSGADKVVVDNPQDWSVSNFDGVNSLNSAVAKVDSDSVSAREGLQVLVDSDEVEDAKVTVQRIKDSEGKDKKRFTFKLTDWSANKITKDLMESGAKSDNAMEVTRYLIKDNPDGTSSLVDTGTTFQKSAQGNDTASMKAKDAGKTYHIPVTNSSGEVIGTIKLHRANKDDSTPEFSTTSTNYTNGPLTFHNTVEIIMNDNVSTTDIEDALRTLGIDDARPATKADIKVIAENKILAVFAPKPAHGAHNFTGQARIDALKAIEESYGVRAEDVEVIPSSGGKQLQFLLPRSVGEALAKKSNVKYFYHSLHSGGWTVDTLVSRLAEQNGLKSSYQRLMNGINKSGMSTNADITLAGGQSIFTSKQNGEYDPNFVPSHHGISYDAAEMLRRIDYYANYGDGYGAKSTGVNFFEMLKGHTHEVMFKNGISWGAMINFGGLSLEERKEVASKLKAMGIGDINGVPINKVLGL